jgi:hypothetical protein
LLWSQNADIYGTRVGSVRRVVIGREGGWVEGGRPGSLNSNVLQHVIRDLVERRDTARLLVYLNAVLRLMKGGNRRSKKSRLSNAKRDQKRSIKKGLKTYNTRDSPVVTHPSTSLAITDIVYGVWEVRNWSFGGKKMAASDLNGRAVCGHPIWCFYDTYQVKMTVNLQPV